MLSEAPAPVAPKMDVRRKAVPVEPSSAARPADNPLFRLKNVIVSPHIAGVTVESTVRMSTQTAQNVLDGLDGRLDPAVVVNREVLQAKIGL